MPDWADLKAIDLWEECQLTRGNTVQSGCNAIAVALRHAHASGYIEGYTETRHEAGRFHGVTLADMAKWRKVMEETTKRKE